MQIARTKGRSIEQSDIGKKCGCADWFVSDINAAKTIINFFLLSRYKLLNMKKINFLHVRKNIR